MSRRIRNLAVVGGAVAMLSFLVVSRLGGTAYAPRPAGIVVSPTIAASPTPRATSTVLPGPAIRGELHSYAVPLTELRGLAPDAVPGTPLDLWVTWHSPIRKSPQVQLLLRSVELQKIIPNVTPQAPPTVLLGVERGEIADLLYGDRYGSLSVVAHVR